MCAVALTDKEAVLFLTRLAALDNAMLAVGPSREQWQKSFLDLLYTMCTRVVPPHVMHPKICHLSQDVHCLLYTTFVELFHT